MAINFTPSDFWCWFENVEDVRDKADMLKQLDANFVRGMSYEDQVILFMPAPLEIIDNIGHLLRPKAREMLLAERNKKLRRITRRK